MPLEALRYSITPVGLHYLLIHYDIPAVDAAGWTAASLAGSSSGPRRSRSRRCKARPRGGARGDDGVRRQRPRAARSAPASASPGCSRRSGRRAGAARRSARCWRRPGRRRGLSKSCSPGPTTGREGGIDQHFQRSLSLDDVARERRAPGLRDERRAAAAAARLPAAADRPRLVRDDERQVADADRRARTSRSPATSRRRATGCGSTRTRRASRSTGCCPRSLMVPPGRAGVPLARAVSWTGPCVHRGARLVGPGRDRRGRRERRRRRDVGAPRSWASLLGRWAWRGWTYRWEPAPGSYELCCRARDSAGNEQPVEPAVEPRRLREQRRPARPGHRRLSKLAGEAPAADHPLRSRPGQVPQLAVRGNEPVRLEARGLADQPLVRRLALRLEDDLDVDVVLLRPELGERDELVPEMFGQTERRTFSASTRTVRRSVPGYFVAVVAAFLAGLDRASRHRGPGWPSTSRRRARPCPSPA